LKNAKNLIRKAKNVFYFKPLGSAKSFLDYNKVT
jgi:hypothetical protein